MPIAEHHRWFYRARYGLFIHWGPYAAIGRGEQSLFREHLDQRAYAQAACDWHPRHADPRDWAKAAVDGGFRYAVLTTRHHDGYCLWDSRLTDYSSAQQAPRRDFVREYTEAFRSAGLRVGLYYSLADWRIPAYWDAAADPAGWDRFRDYVHGQVEELLTGYGRIDQLWFDGAWPHSADAWRSPQLLARIRTLQPGILINNRLGVLENAKGGGGTDSAGGPAIDGGLGTGESRTLGDFSTPEHHITAAAGRLWESCQVSTWRLWGHARGERWRPADVLLDFLVDAASKGGNLLLNVGPDGDGRFPHEFLDRSDAIGDWLRVHGEAIREDDATVPAADATPASAANGAVASEAATESTTAAAAITAADPGPVVPGDTVEFVTRGRITRRGNTLYLIIRFWPGRPTLTLEGITTAPESATLLTTGTPLAFDHTADRLTIHGLPIDPPTDLFPVIRLRYPTDPHIAPWARARLWTGDPRRMRDWAAGRGEGVRTDGSWA